MSLYFRTLYAWKCKGTHHKLAMDALRLLEGKEPQKWRNLFLKHAESYLTGSKDPDKKFKDFRNHVLHVGDNYWGGAIKATHKWYAEARQAFADGRWREGVYATGVMSHYFTDVCCPLHTAQSDKETIIHRACEWSVSCSYDDLIDALEEDFGGYPELTLPKGSDWLDQLIRQQAEYSYQRYTKVVEGYRFDLGAKNPPAGLEDEIFKEFSLLLGQAGSSLSLVIAQCLEESKQSPPSVSLSMQTMLANLTIPIFWITKKMADAQERTIVNKIYDELQRTGTVEEALPEENRVIRELVKKERGTNSSPTNEKPVSNKPVKQAVSPAQEYERAADADKPSEEETVQIASPFEATPPDKQRDSIDTTASQPQHNQQKNQRSSTTRFYLRREDPIVDAPSIGPKTASRFRKIGLHRVDDFLNADPGEMASQLNTRWITADLVAAWQQQSQLMCTVPGLRGHDAQILSGVGVESKLDLAEMNADDLLPLVNEFVGSSEGIRILRSSNPPDLEEVTEWISNARQVAQNRAA